MYFQNLLQLNIIYFIIISFITIYSIDKLLIHFLKKKNIYDINEKKNNNFVYTGFGFSFVIITLFYFIVFLFFADIESKYYHVKYLPVPLSIIIIGSIGFLDDYKGTPVHLRILLFFLCCFLSTSSINNDILPFISYHKIQLIILTFFWVYVINASNFLDGGDRYYVNFILPNSIFFLIYYYYLDFDIIRVQINILIIIFILHFSFYNKNPAKLFLGDSGSLVLGFIYCWNIFNLIENKEIVLAIILTQFILTDVSITLLLRTFNKKNIFSRHKGFFIHVSKYLGRTNKNISNTIFIVNIIFVILALIYKLFLPSLLILFLAIIFNILYLAYMIKFKLSNLKYTYIN